MVAETQKLVADGMSRWIDLATAPFGTSVSSMEALGGLFDARRLTEEGFRLAEGLLASQKEFTLKVVEAISSKEAA